jgi:dihydrofolate reductase
MRRPRCSVFLAMSLDGYIAGPHDELDWLESMQGEEHGYTAFFAAIDALILGRRTYEVVLAFPTWPYADKRVYVMTNRAAAPRDGVTFVHGAAAEVLAGVDARHVYVDGGSVVRQCLAAKLVDDLTISVVPKLLGAGIRLFERGEPGPDLELLGAQAFKNGLVQLRYQVRTT